MCALCVCVCERERDRVTSQHISYLNRSVCVRETGSHFRTSAILIAACVCVCVCVSVRECVCVRERERRSHHSGVYSVSEIVLIAACLQTHRSFITVSVTRLCSPLGLELMLKLRTLLTVFTLILKAEARDYGKGCYISNECLRCSANHNALGQLANQSRLRLSEGGTL